MDAHEQTLIDDRTKSVANDPVDVNEMKQSSRSEAEKSGAADIMHKKILEQMQWLCRTVQDTENRIEGKIEHEGLERHQENQKLKEEVRERMSERLKNEESARKNVLAAMKEEIRQIKLESGSTACIEASTAVGKVPAVPLQDRRLALQLATMRCSSRERWNSKGGLQTTQEVVAAFVLMIPSSAQRFVDREQTRTEQGSWPTKTMVSLWFKSETNLGTMIELLRVVKAELNKKAVQTS